MSYGISINDLEFSDPKYFYSHQLNSSHFTAFTTRKYFAAVSIPMGKLKQCLIDDFLNTKIFVRKKTRFSKKASCVYSGTDAVESAVIGNDCCYIDNIDNQYYIVCSNPDDYEFLVYKKIDSLLKTRNKQPYGLEVYNQNGAITFNSTFDPCILLRIVNCNEICNSNIIVNTPSAGYPRSGMEIPNLLEINQNNVNIGYSYCELGITASVFQQYQTKSPLYPKQVSGFYSMLVDGSGELRYVPCIGIIIGQNDMIRGIRDFGSMQNMNLNRNGLFIGVINRTI